MKILIKFIQLFVTLILAWIIITKLDLVRLKAILLSVNLFYIVLFVAVYPVSVWISTNRWQVVLKQIQIQLPFWELYKSYWVGSFYNNFLHELGGDFYKSFGLSKRFKISLKQLYLTTFVERLSGFFCLLFLALLFCFPSILQVIKPLNLSVQILILFILLELIAIIFFKFQTQIKAKLKPLKVFLDKKTILKLSLWSLFFVGEGLFAYYFIFASLGYKLSVFSLLSTVPLIQLAGVIPITPNALGVTEGIAVLFLKPKGLPVEVIITGMLLIRSLLFFINALGAFIIQAFTKTNFK